MRQEKNNSSLQQRDLEVSKEEIEYKEKEKQEKKKSLREMFEEEENIKTAV